MSSFKLIIQEGPQPGKEIELNGLDVVIGRDASVELHIPSPAVSRRHARVSVQAGAAFIEDLGSSNGTFVNEQRIQQKTSLKNGDSIRLGQGIVLSFSAPIPQMAVSPSVMEAQPAATMLQTMAESSDAFSETILGEDAPLASPSTPPQLTVAIAGGKHQTYTLTKAQYTLGRQEDNDIVIPSPIVSRKHARLEKVDGGYRLAVLPEAGNPMLFEGRPLTAARQLMHGDIVRIGSVDPGVMVSLSYISPAEAGAAGARAVNFHEKSTIQVGRDPGNDLVVNAPTVSRFHAQIEKIGSRHRVRDLRSSNGTFVNGQRIDGEAWLQPDDQVRIGPFRLVMGVDTLTPIDETNGLKVEATGLNKWVRKDLNLLKDISVIFQPKEFIVVVGQSGGGKSTFLDAIAGYRPATHGKVMVNGIDVYRNFDAIRNDIGFVPQKDIIHMELTVYEALDYAAQLRMTPDTSKDERHQRVMEVLEDLDLTHRKDVKISGLSGGQQKRVSIGVELLTKPGLFFLDEPTSGLDPGTETALMQLMRRLADQGRTIVLITHATKNVMLADKVIFLARGGYLAWFGPPEEALEHFDRYRSDRDRRVGKMEFDEIYAILDNASTGSAEVWAKRYQETPAFQKYVVQPLQGKLQEVQPVRQAVAKSAAPQRQQASQLRQFMILSSRNLKILVRDRFSLILMLAAPVIIGSIDFLIAALLGRNIFDYNEGEIMDVIITLFMLTINSIMVGALSQMREIVKEQDIYKRERLVNLKVLPYVLSKIWVAGLLAFYQSAAYLLIRYLAFDMPGGMFEFGLIYITLTIGTMAGMMLGLFTSALAPNANSAPLIVILLLIPQFILGGGLIPLPTSVSWPTASRWGFEGLSAITGGGSDVAADVCWALPDEARKEMSIEDKQAAGCRCMGLNVLREDSCNFPGIGQFYDPDIERPKPIEPREIGDPPPEPALPERPIEPADQSDSVAMAEFFNAIKAWEAEVKVIQEDYKRQLEDYQARAEVFKAEAIAFQEDLVEWEITRASAVQPAESVIDRFYSNFGWSFVNKEDDTLFWSKVLTGWLAQFIFMGILFAAILYLQKRKDVV